MADTESHQEDRDEREQVEEEDTGATFAPLVKLEEVAVTTGEEDEETILDQKAKLYRFDKDGSQWKERGAGNVKLLKHKTTGKIRLVMRQSKTLKICANHLILPKMFVQEHAGNDKSCVWHAADYADGELKQENFCIRFPSVENNRAFMEKFQEAAESQEKTEEDESVSSDAVKKLSIEDKDEEKKGSSAEAEAKDTPSSAA